MSGYIEGVDRGQSLIFPERLEDWIGEDNTARVIDLFVDDLDLVELGFQHSAPARTGRPGYYPGVLLKLFIYGYLNRIPSSRRLECESGNRKKGLYVKADFAYDAAEDVYRCPAGEELTYRYTRDEDGLKMRRYWTGSCQDCMLKDHCTSAKERCVTRWEHEQLVDEMQTRISGSNGWMRLR